MNASSFRIACRYVVFLFLAWPIAHRYLARTYDLNPWKMCGFAMYCDPHNVTVLITKPAGESELEFDRSKLSADLQNTFTDFSVRRYYFGKFAAPDDLIAELKTQVPQGESYSLIVQIQRLNPRTGMIVTKRDYFPIHGDETQAL